jgi:hypothetical protein
MLENDLDGIYVYVGETELAIKQFETLAQVPRGPTYGDLGKLPDLDQVRNDPRFQKLIVRTKADPNRQSSGPGKQLNLLLSVKTGTDFPQQFVRGKGLFYEIRASAQWRVIAQNIVGITATKDDFQVGFVGSHLVKQGLPIHPSGHDNIGYDQLDRLMVLPPNLQRTVARNSGVDLISVPDQHIPDRPPYSFLIFN